MWCRDKAAEVGRAQVILAENLEGKDFAGMIFKRLTDELTADKKAFADGVCTRLGYHFPLLFSYFRYLFFGDPGEPMRTEAELEKLHNPPEPKGTPAKTVSKPKPVAITPQRLVVPQQRPPPEKPMQLPIQEVSVVQSRVEVGESSSQPRVVTITESVGRSASLTVADKVVGQTLVSSSQGPPTISIAGPSCAVLIEEVNRELEQDDSMSLMVEPVIVEEERVSRVLKAYDTTTEAETVPEINEVQVTTSVDRTDPLPSDVQKENRQQTIDVLSDVEKGRQPPSVEQSGSEEMVVLQEVVADKEKVPVMEPIPIIDTPMKEPIKAVQEEHPHKGLALTNVDTILPQLPKEKEKEVAPSSNKDIGGTSGPTNSDLEILDINQYGHNQSSRSPMNVQVSNQPSAGTKVQEEDSSGMVWSNDLRKMLQDIRIPLPTREQNEAELWRKMQGALTQAKPDSTTFGGRVANKMAEVLATTLFDNFEEELESQPVIMQLRQHLRKMTAKRNSERKSKEEVLAQLKLQKGTNPHVAVKETAEYKELHAKLLQSEKSRELARSSLTAAEGKLVSKEEETRKLTTHLHQAMNKCVEFEAKSTAAAQKQRLEQDRAVKDERNLRLMAESQYAQLKVTLLAEEVKRQLERETKFNANLSVEKTRADKAEADLSSTTQLLNEREERIEELSEEICQSKDYQVLVVNLANQAYQQLREEKEREMKEKEARISELEEEVQTVVADRETAAEEADQAIIERDRLIVDRERLKERILQACLDDMEDFAVDEGLVSTELDAPEEGELQVEPLIEPVAPQSASYDRETNKPTERIRLSDIPIVKDNDKPVVPTEVLNLPVAQVELARSGEKRTRWDTTTWYAAAPMAESQRTPVK